MTSRREPVALQSRCAWCGRIKVGTRWVAARRGLTPVVYTHGICPSCFARHAPPGTAYPA